MAQKGSGVAEQAMGQGVAVTPSDVTVLQPTAALWVGTGGDLTVTGLDGVDYTLANVPDGTPLRLAVTKVKAATTASDIVALYL